MGTDGEEGIPALVRVTQRLVLQHTDWAIHPQHFTIHGAKDELTLG